jgi:hypothetical protein
MSHLDDSEKVDLKAADEHIETTLAGAGGLATLGLGNIGSDGPVSRFNHLTSLQAVRKFWRLYLWGLTVTIAGM